jgi:hypothetical protein
MLRYFKRLFGSCESEEGEGSQSVTNDDPHYSAYERIAWVAASIKDAEVFKDRARIAAEQLGPQSIRGLPRFFHNPPEEPSDVTGQFPGLGDWMAACQFAIFEILYHFREASLPLLRRVAFGPYDWTQANAIDILCRFGIEGIQRERIAQELAEDFPNWRYEAITYSIESLAKFAAFAPPVMQVLEDLIREWGKDDPIDALEIIEPLVRNVPESAKMYEPELRELMRTTGRQLRDPLCDGHVGELTLEDGTTAIVAGGPTHPSVEDYHAIRAAFLLKELFPDDTEVRANLEEWAESHPDAQMRKEITAQLV